MFEFQLFRAKAAIRSGAFSDTMMSLSCVADEH